MEKQQIKLSAYSFIGTIITLVVLVGCTFIIPEIWWQIGWCVFVAIMLIASLCYMPMSIGADENTIYINRSLKIKTIPMTDVKSVQLHVPSLKTVRVCGSGGFLGYWGWFSEQGVGRYFAYYGKRNDCFLVELKNGRKYLLGCQNAPEMVEYIAKQIKK